MNYDLENQYEQYAAQLLDNNFPAGLAQQYAIQTANDFLNKYEDLYSRFTMLDDITTDFTDLEEVYSWSHNRYANFNPDFIQDLLDLQVKWGGQYRKSKESMHFEYYVPISYSW
jgi:pantothenate kinase-related protein Tda10